MYFFFSHYESRNARLNTLKFQIFDWGVGAAGKSYILLQWCFDGSDSRPQVKTVKCVLKIELLSDLISLQHSTQKWVSSAWRDLVCRLSLQGDESSMDRILKGWNRKTTVALWADGTSPQLWGSSSTAQSIPYTAQHSWQARRHQQQIKESPSRAWSSAVQAELKSSLSLLPLVINILPTTH